MKFSPPRSTESAHRARGFTLAEVLAAMLVMAIVIPIALQGMAVASRAGLAGTRKAAAMRVAERVLNEELITGRLTQSSASGSVSEGDTTYRWTLESSSWSQDTMTQATVRVTFTVQGTDYQVSASTLFDPNAASSATGSSTTP
jgi:prepilin-type N-terminal cleavage/methylation domain-containing protein